MSENAVPWVLEELREETRRVPDATTSVGGTLQQVREAARRTGWEEGYAAGQSQAVADQQEATSAAVRARAEIEGVVAALREAVEQVRVLDAISVEDAGREAVELAYKLCEQILEREVSRDGAVLLACEKAVALLAVREGISLRVSPQDAEAVREAVGETARVIPDQMVKPGGCVAEAGSKRVDLRWEAALVRVRESLGLA